MNLFGVHGHHRCLQPSFPHHSQASLPHLPFFPVPHELKLRIPSSLSLSKPNSKLSPIRVSEIGAPLWTNKGEENGEESSVSEDLTAEGKIYQKTLRLVECSMFAALGGLAYVLSSSLAIENYFGCFFPLPIIFSSMRWDIVAGRKTMVATATLLLVLSGPIKALTYLLMYGFLGLSMGCLWRSRASWGLSIFVSTLVVFLLYTEAFSHLIQASVQGFLAKFLIQASKIVQVRAMGALGYVVVYSFLIKENILALITINIHASATFIISSFGYYAIPSMNVVYAIFVTVLLLNSCFFVFLLHLLYALFFTRLGMRSSLRLPRWLENAL